MTDISDSVRIQNDVTACEECGSTSRVGRGLCLNCLLHRGITEIESTEGLKEVLDEVDIRDADWRIGNYQILEEIGRGGMGVIYRARQRHSRRIVALKRVLSFHADSRETLARFRREAEAAASLDHPNILPIYEVSESEDGLPFFSMKFAAGGSLFDAARTLRADPRRTVVLVAKVTRAVQHAHGQGILHRDLKPGNILLDGRGEPLVSDFGLAKWLDVSSDLTRTLTIFGTPGYIAPEQAQGPAKNLTAAADIYSIGAVLFDLFTGRPPFLGEHALAVIKQASDKPAPKLRTLAPLADRDLETICARCLEREPHARYRSAGDLAEDLERWLEGRPIIARPVAPPVRIWRWSKRNPKLAGSLAACLLLGGAAAVWQIQSTHLQRTVRQGQLAAHSVAVLPFLNLDTALPDETLTNAIARSLQGNLARFGPAHIVPVWRTEAWLAGSGNAQDITEANSTTRARAVLTGSERLVNGKLRLSIRLLNAANGDVLLMRVLDVAPNSSVSEEMARATVPALRPILDAKDWSTITPSARDPGMRDPSAREFITSGRQLMLRANISDIDRSIKCFEKALELEPHSALAHAYLAGAAAGRLHFGWAEQFRELSEREAREALRLEPSLSDAHRALAALLYNTGNLSESLEEQFRAIEAEGPEERGSSLLGMTLIALGRPAQALGWLELAKHWASLPGDYDALIGNCWMFLGEDQRAEDAYRRSINLRPENPEGWVGLCHLRLLQGDVIASRKMCLENRDRFKNYDNPDADPRQMAAAIEFFARDYGDAERLYADLKRADSDGGSHFYGALDYASVLGRLQQARGDTAGARTVLERCRNKEEQTPFNDRSAVSLYRLAAIESSLGNVNGAIENLRAATERGWIDIRSTQIDPRFDGIASDERFRHIIATVIERLAESRRHMGQPFSMANNGGIRQN
jgi:tetratricopeptide (TPR) repeat protein/TolB-like protein/predicted Ser/Thr protein kinase